MYELKLSCLIIVLLARLIFTCKQNKSRINVTYSNLLNLTLVHFLADFATVYTVNHLDTVPAWLNRLMHSLFFLTMLLVFNCIYMYIRAMIEHENQHPLPDNKFAKLGLVLLFFSLTASILLPLDYVETPNGNYSTGLAAYILYSSIGVYLVLFVRLMIVHRKVIPEQKARAMRIVILAEVLVSIYQMIVPTSLVSSLGITIIVIGFYITVENPNQLLVDELQEAYARADAANNAKTSFLANMSHEIRTPINAIMGMNEMILRESRESEIRNYAGEAKSAAESLLGIINDILDITKIEAGKLNLIVAEYKLAPLIIDLTNLVRMRAQAKSLKLEVIADEDLPSVLKGDDIRLKQILLNLLSNAVKYTQKGQVTFEIKRLSEDEIRFSVTDTGIGIKPEDIERLFAAFDRIEEERNRNIEGTGLGLNIATNLLKMMGSELDVQSEYGIGSTFAFTLKQDIVDNTPIGKLKTSFRQHEGKTYLPKFEAPDAHILVVDDNAMNRKVFANLLKDTKIRITEASSGLECLEAAADMHFDMIFLDHMMPEMDGVQTFEVMRRQKVNLNKDTPVIVLTANAVTGAKDYYMSVGFDGFLSKPIDPAKLESMVYDMLDESLIKPCSKTADDLAAPLPEEKPELPIIEGLDWNYARLHFKSDDAMLDTVRLFRKALEREAQQLIEFFVGLEGPGGLTGYRVQVHSMKSSAAIIGITQLAGMAMELEKAARNGNIKLILTMHSIFITRWLSYREALAIFEEHEAPAKEAENYADELAEIFEQIRCAAEEMDVDRLDDLSRQLEEFSFDEVLTPQIEQVKEQIFNFQVEELAQCRIY